MALFKYFSPSGSVLPTASEAGISEVATKQANEAVREELQRQQSDVWLRGRKRKAYTHFTYEQQAAIGKYATENGNSAAVKKFKGAVNIDLCMYAIKEPGCKWLVFAYDHIRSCPDIISNRFRKALPVPWKMDSQTMRPWKT